MFQKNLVKSTKVTDLCIGFDEFFQISSKVQIFVMLYCDLTSYSNLVKSIKVTNFCIGFDEFFQILSKVKIFVI